MPLIIFCWHAKHWPPSRLSAFLNSSSAPVLSSSCTSLRPSWYAFCTFSLTGPPCGSWVVSGAFYPPKRSKGIPQCLSFLYIVTRGFLPTLAQTPDRPVQGGHMKRSLITGILTTLTLLLLIIVPSTYAQATIEVTVPFNFMVGKAEMPAGTYTINRLSSSAIEIKGSTTQKSAVSIVWSEGPSGSDSAAKLVFN